MDTRTPEVIVIGGAIVDVLLQPVDAGVFAHSSTAVEGIRLSTGGDALNEATVLARLGHPPLLATKLGGDAAAGLILDHCSQEGVAVHAVRQPGLDTGVNAVLVAPSGERSFITNRNGSLRRLAIGDVLPALEGPAFASAQIVCLASMFVSPMMGIPEMAELFSKVKASGKILCADATRCKNGETLADAAPALRHLDYFFPNLDEARALTGRAEPDAIADALFDAGVKNAVVKLGSSGSLVRNAQGRWLAPCFPVARCVDTTGAGDTFAASFIAALLEGRPPEQCAAYANAAASLCIEQLGATTAVLDRAEIQRRFEEIRAQIRKF